MATPKEIRTLAQLVGTGQVSYDVSVIDPMALSQYLKSLEVSTNDRVSLPHVNGRARLNMDLWTLGTQKPQAGFFLGKTYINVPENLDAFSYPTILVKRLVASRMTAFRTL